MTATIGVRGRWHGWPHIALLLFPLLLTLVALPPTTALAQSQAGQTGTGSAAGQAATRRAGGAQALTTGLVTAGLVAAAVAGVAVAFGGGGSDDGEAAPAAIAITATDTR